MSRPQAHSQTQKRTANDFFKPYTSAVPAKRPSPTPENHSGHDRSPKKPKTVPKTPSTTRIIDFQSSPAKSPFHLGHSPHLPIRSPRPQEQGTPSGSRSKLFSSPLTTRPSPAKAPAPLSFSDLPKSSKNVVKDGKVIAIRDSDEDDSESLESLEDIFGRSRGGNTSSSSPLDDEVNKENRRPSIMGVFSNRERQAIVGKDKLRDILAKERSHKFDIRKLIDDHLNDAETRQKLDKANAYYQASANQAELEKDTVKTDQDLLRDIVDGKGGDREEIAKVLGAMERTGALSSEQSFSFFAEGGWTDWQDEAPPKHKFPDQGLPQDFEELRRSESRDMAYLLGDLGDIDNHGQLFDGQLPESLLRWSFESIVLERRDDLREAYIRCLAGSSPRWTRINLTAQDIQDVFERLGADSEVLRDRVNIAANRRHAPSQRSHDPKYLLSVLGVLNALADDLDFTALSKFSSILTRLSLDEKAMSNGYISTSVEETYARLLSLANQQSRLHVAERILTDMGDNLKDSSLQARLLRHILPTSPLAARLRLLLAQVFLLNSQVKLTDLTENPSVSLPALLQHLRSSAFDLAHRTSENPIDYAFISAQACLLDITILDGGRPSTFSSADEKAFNRQVDDLADRVNTIFSAIADTGASHLRRTEAKEALGVLQKQLLYAVRTKPRPKKNVFGGRDGKEYRDEERSKNAMSKYLMKKQDGNGDVTSSSQHSETEKLIRRQLQLSP